MAADIIAQDMAALALAARPRTLLSLTVVGQSNERGSVALGDAAAWPQAFQSQRNPGGVRVPLGPAISLTGGAWCRVYDDLFDWGYDPQIVNAAIGSMSMMLDGAGYVKYRNNGAAYYGRRAPVSSADRGYVGDLMSPDGNSYWVCTTGNTRYALNDGPRTIGEFGFGAAFADSVATLSAQTPGTAPYLVNLVTAASAPSFPGAVGAVVTDGGIVWQCIATITASPYANAGTVLSETQKGWGFDPFGILVRAHEETQRVRGVTRRLVYIANGQGDVGNGSTQYQTALTSVANFFLARGYEVILGFTNYSPGTTGTLTQWNALRTGQQAALAALQAANPGRVWAGADLFAAMGTTGVMGGAKITGSVSAGGTLTVSALSQGVIEIGHNVWNAAGVLVGTITAGSGTSWTVSAPVTTANGALIVAGAFLQYDGVHLNGAGMVGPAAGGVSCAGSFISAVIRATMPRIPR